jgi:predicted HD superfamily hydrolase involved in NAD metabolism
MTEILLPSLDTAQTWMRTRVSARRLNHVKGVAETAKLLAIKAGIDPFRAELAGWLHDACKEEKDVALVEQARRYGLKLHPVEEENGHLLHGPIAAEVVKRQFNIDDEELLDAIRQHTLGATNMTMISKVVFLADASEPGRSEDCRRPIWSAVEREKDLGIEKALNLAVKVACDLSLDDLIRHGRVIHPRTVEVRNYYLCITREYA